MLIYYKNSVLASVVSMIGCAFVIGGIAGGMDVGSAVAFVALGVALAIWGKCISNNKAFKTWWKQITDNNLEPQIAASQETAIAVYQKNPQKRTLNKIAALNPTAAQYIQQNLMKKK